MVAVKVPTLAQTYASLCAFLKTNPKLTVVVSNHIAAKHGIHSLPAFHTSDAVTEQEKLVTYGEVVRAIVGKDHSKLKGQVANGQADAPAAPAPAPAPAPEPAPVAEHPLPRRDSILPIVPSTGTRPDPAAEKEKQGRAALSTMRKLGFIGDGQAKAVLAGMQGEEKEYFFDKMIELLGIVEKMPSTGKSDGTVYLRYFAGGQAKWFITEKDKGDPSDAEQGVPPQSQAFGLADLYGDGGEVGYISIAEILENNGELDFHWTPTSLTKIQKQDAPAPASAPERIISDTAHWCRKPGSLREAYALTFGHEQGDGYIQSRCDFHPSIVAEEKHLTNAEFDKLFEDDALYAECDWLKGKGGHRVDGDKCTHYHAILVTAPDRPRLLINPEGHNYARYVGLLHEDKETWRRLAERATPVGASPAPAAPALIAPSPYRPFNDKELHAYLDHCIEAARRIPGSTIQVTICLPTHV